MEGEQAQRVLAGVHVQLYLRVLPEPCPMMSGMVRMPADMMSVYDLAVGAGCICKPCPLHIEEGSA